MERILQILGIGVITFVLIALISSMANGCNSNKEVDKKDQTEIVADSTNTGDIDLEEDIFNEESEDGKTDDSKTTAKAGSTENENIDDFIDYSGESKETKTTPSSTVKKSTNSKLSNTATKYQATSTGSYLVVAGSYLVRDNAAKMKRRLNGLGYNHAEIVNFDLSQYYSVLAGRFSSRSEAKEVVEILGRNNIDSYVHRKKR